MKTECVDAKLSMVDIEGRSAGGPHQIHSGPLPPCGDRNEFTPAGGEPAPSRRIEGYDLARALAILGMVMINFDSIADFGGNDPGWLRSMLDWIEGRAAVIFVTLAGVGISLKAQAARRQKTPPDIGHFRFILLKRGLVLFLAGFGFNLVWPADILHFYGAYMAIAAVVLTAPACYLLAVALLSVLSSAVWLTLFNADMGFFNWVMPSGEYPWSPLPMTLDLLFDGYYPVLPWTAFLLLGMWIGRQDITRPAVRWGLAAVGLIFCLVAEPMAERVAVWLFNMSADPQLDLAMWWMTIDPWTPLPAFVLSGAGTALLAIILCIRASEKLKQSRLHRALLATGRMSLTVYVGHILVGLGAKRLYPETTFLTVSVVTAAALVFFAGALVFCSIWSRHFARGPLEGWMQQMVSLQFISRIRPGSIQRPM